MSNNIYEFVCISILNYNIFYALFFVYPYIHIYIYMAYSHALSSYIVRGHKQMCVHINGILT